MQDLVNSADQSAPSQWFVLKYQVLCLRGTANKAHQEGAPLSPTVSAQHCDFASDRSKNERSFFRPPILFFLVVLENDETRPGCDSGGLHHFLVGVRWRPGFSLVSNCDMSHEPSFLGKTQHLSPSMADYAKKFEQATPPLRKQGRGFAIVYTLLELGHCLVHVMSRNGGGLLHSLQAEQNDKPSHRPPRKLFCYRIRAIQRGAG